LFVDLIPFLIVIVPIASILGVFLAHLTFFLTFSFLFLLSFVVDQLLISFFLVLDVDVGLLATRSLTRLVLHVFFFLLFVDIAHLLVCFLGLPLALAFALALFLFGVHFSLKIIFHFDVVFFLIVGIFILVLFLIFMPHNLLLKLDFIPHVFSSVMGLSLTYAHTFPYLLTAALLILLGLLLDA
jgi:hypothetical protein